MAHHWSPPANARTSCKPDQKLSGRRPLRWMANTPCGSEPIFETEAVKMTASLDALALAALLRGATDPLMDGNLIWWMEISSWSGAQVTVCARFDSSWHVCRSRCDRSRGLSAAGQRRRRFL